MFLVSSFVMWWCCGGMDVLSLVSVLFDGCVFSGGILLVLYLILGLGRNMILVLKIVRLVRLCEMLWCVVCSSLGMSECCRNGICLLSGLVRWMFGRCLLDVELCRLFCVLVVNGKVGVLMKFVVVRVFVIWWCFCWCVVRLCLEGGVGSIDGMWLSLWMWVIFLVSVYLLVRLGC